MKCVSNFVKLVVLVIVATTIAVCPVSAQQYAGILTTGATNDVLIVAPITHKGIRGTKKNGIDLQKDAITVCIDTDPPPGDHTLCGAAEVSLFEITETCVDGFMDHYCEEPSICRLPTEVSTEVEFTEVIFRGGGQ